MRAKALWLAAVLAAASGAAWAQTAWMNAREARSALFGMEMSGTYEGDGTPFRECVDPQGHTVYYTEGGVDYGRLTITPEGRACFAYQSTNFQYQSCFAARRDGDGFRFQAAPGDPEFHASHVRRGVRTCSGSNAPIS